jgi:cobalamin biosynthesis protein CbiG
MSGSAAEAFASVWRSGEPIIFVGALGIAMRFAAPLISGKLRDPALVVVDDAGRWAIPVLGGHQANANALAKGAADLIGAVPVITTGSDQLDLPAIDELGSDRGWRVFGSRDARLRASAAVVNGEPVALFQDAGERYEHRAFRRFESLEALCASSLPAVAITDRIVHQDIVVVRPATLAIGIGCRRGTPLEALTEHIERTLTEHALAIESVAVVATADIKGDEEGLLELARERGWRLVTYAAGELARVPVPTPSANVRRLVGVSSVAEAAAMLVAGNELLIRKTKAPAITVAVARIASG